MPAAACFGQDPHRVLMPTLALVREGPPPGVPRPTGMRLLDQVRAAIRVRHYSRRKDVSTTMIYTHVLNRSGRGVRSPLDGGA
jgi:hypothetical protein